MNFICAPSSALKDRRVARIHFIVNPNRPAIGLRWPYEEQRIQALTKDFKVHIVRGRLHAEILARQAADEGAELVVSIGGDSTLSEIANGLYRASLGGMKIPKLAIHAELHAGDAVKSLPLNKSFIEFLGAFLRNEAISDLMDLAEVEFSGEYGQKIRRVFVNCAGFGFSSVIVERLAADFRYRRTRWNFLKMIARLIPFYKHPVVNIKIDGKDYLRQRPILTGLLHNGRYAAHGFDFSEESSPFDGTLEATIIRKTFTWRYFLAIFPLFAGLLHRASFVLRTPFKEIEIQPAMSGRRVRVDFDGDCWGFLPARISVRPKSLELVR